MSGWQSRRLVLSSFLQILVNYGFSCQIVAFQFALLALPFSCALSWVSAVLLLSAMGRPFPCSDSIFIRVHACFFLVLDILCFTVLPCSAPPNAWKSSGSKFTFLPHATSSCFLFLAACIASSCSSSSGLALSSGTVVYFVSRTVLEHAGSLWGWCGSPGVEDFLLSIHFWVGTARISPYL